MHSISKDESTVNQNLPTSARNIMDEFGGETNNTSISNAEVHQLYQDLFLTDLKHEISEVKSVSVQFRQENVELHTTIDKIKKENTDLKKVVSKYRQMLVDQEKKVSDLAYKLDKA